MDLRAIRHSPQVIAQKFAEIRTAMFQESRAIRQPNFETIGTGDLARLFRLYDDRFLDGWLANAITSTGGSTLTFRLSSAMTRSGGKTIRKSPRLKSAAIATKYEIAIATRMLLMNFRDGQRPVTVCGLVCEDRLAALQRIMEHEMLHLAEFLAWGKSSCNQSRFKQLARNIFGHAASKHDLITAVERASTLHAVSIGNKVEFDFHGKTLAGIINRVHRRATVLVESKDGAKYRNGKRYLKYYIPLGMLRTAAK
jgi:hypothetical protein